MITFYNINISKTTNTTKTYKTNNTKIYNNYKTLLKNNTINIIHIYTPNNSHYKITITKLHTNKHIIYKKPITKTTTKTQKIINTTKSTNKKLTINYQNHFQTNNQFLHQTTQHNNLKNIYFKKTHTIHHQTIPT